MSSKIDITFNLMMDKYMLRYYGNNDKNFKDLLEICFNDDTISRICWKYVLIMIQFQGFVGNMF